eukprot:6257902-Amphidinium_carterae.2
MAHNAATTRAYDEKFENSTRSQTRWDGTKTHPHETKEAEELLQQPHGTSPHPQSNDLRQLLVKLAHIEKWAHGVDRKLARMPPSQQGEHEVAHPTGGLAPSEEDDIPPTLDYGECSDAPNGSVAMRVAELERTITQQQQALGEVTIADPRG